MDLKEYPDREFMMMQLADLIAGELKNCLLVNDHALIAVPGGNTPGPMFDTLCGTRLEWDRVHVILTDERRVPADHERSNERLVRERLLVDRAAEARFSRLVPDDTGDVADLSDRIAPELPLSILILGMGPDMHTASLFPGSPQLDDALHTDAALIAVDAPEGLEPRISLTGSVLRGAMSTHVMITGSEKRAAIERARQLPPEQAPIALVLGEATVHWAE